MSRTASSGLRTLAIVLFLVGLVLLVIGIVYYTVPLGSLPSFLGHVAGSTKHHTRRALGGVVAGVVCLAAGAFALARSRRR